MVPMTGKNQTSEASHASPPSAAALLRRTGAQDIPAKVSGPPAGNVDIFVKITD
jgi:hypothetical protein